jgi:L-asparaginase II
LSFQQDDYRPCVYKTRSGRVETIYRACGVLYDSKRGEIVSRIGNPYTPIFPRSALKPVQAIPFSKLNPDPRFLAIACGSHAGEAQHLEILKDFSKNYNLNTDDLVCGPALPISKRIVDNQPEKLKHNCSGKHLGMMACCEGLDQRYQQLDHPVQQSIQAVLERFCDKDLIYWGQDGCGLPTPQLPLIALAQAFSYIQDNHPGIFSAMKQYPQLVSGPERLDTDWMGRSPVVCKIGAEAVHAGYDNRFGLSWALKVECGEKSVIPLVWARLYQLANINQTDVELTNPVLDSNQQVVGSIGLTI